MYFQGRYRDFLNTVRNESLRSIWLPYAAMNRKYLCQCHLKRHAPFGNGIAYSIVSSLNKRLKSYKIGR